MSKNNSYRYKWIAFLIFSMTSVSFAQMGSLWDLNNKVDDLVFELEMQRLEKSNRGYIGSNPFKWPANLKHLLDEDGVSHFVDPQSIAGNKRSMQANFYVVLPKIKINKFGTYKYLGRLTVISCETKLFQEITLVSYKPDYTVDKIHNQSSNLSSIKFEPEQSPAEKKYMRYVCGN